MAQCFMFSRNMFVWVDETGADSRDHIRKYGHALRGMTPESKRLLVRGKRTNTVVGLTSSDIVASMLAQTTVTGGTFFDFAHGSLLPMMQPLHPDNGQLFHTQCCGDKGPLPAGWNSCAVSPTLQPDLNPIEEAFNYVQNYPRKHDQLL